MSEPYDPLHTLRTPIVPVAPDPVFAARLRARLVRALLIPTQEEMMTDVLLRHELSRNGTRPGDVSYVSLAVPDAARARAFYAAVLGWSYGPGQIEFEGNQVDDVIPQVGLWPQPEATRAPGAVLGFRVADLAVAVAAVREQGGTATDPVREPFGLSADCRDDQGLEFHLHELPPPGSIAPANGEREGDISYISLHVADPARARAFFAAVLGWAFVPGRVADGANVEGPTPMIGMASAPGRPGAVLSYRVGDIAASIARVRQAGGTATDPVRRPYAWEATCSDDQGIPFYLHQFSS